MEIKIALAGNPNCGKTTMFNALTGSSQYVGNWPGVTVEKKEGRLKGKENKDVVIMDLPGIYSLSPYTLEEVVSRNYLLQDQPQVILNIVDATNIERNLYLTTQLMEIGIPVVIALNMMDIVRKNGDKINVKKLAAAIGCPVVETSALKGDGVMQAALKAVSVAQTGVQTPPSSCFSQAVEQAVNQIEQQILSYCDRQKLRWFAVKLFERDDKAMEQIPLPDQTEKAVEQIIAQVEETLDDDSESIITNERYGYISQLLSSCYVKKRRAMTASDKIDRIVTNRWLAFPIFVLVMFFVYYISVSTVGGWATDWVNEGLFGGESWSIPTLVGNLFESWHVAPWLNSLVLDGIVAGMGAVLGFVPQLLVLFFLLALLEDCGYMARIAFIMDRFFRKFGLSGKSFIPMLIGTGCGVPGIMASRTIENDRDRKMTIMTTTFIPCSAKLPIIALIAGALFSGAWWVAPSAYFVGVAAIVCSGILLKKTKLFRGEPAPFVMELPAYHVPGAKGVLTHMWERGWSFIKKAGTIIFLSCCLIWFLQAFGVENGRFGMVEDMESSLLAWLGGIIAPLFAPLGWGNWKTAVATITGLVAKENVVGTLGILFGTEVASENGVEIWANMQAGFTGISAYSFMVFNLLCAPCFAAIGAIKREMNSPKWTLFTVGYQTALAYAAALCVYQIGSLFTGGAFGVGTAAALLVLAVFLFLLFRPYKESSHLEVHTGGKHKKEKVNVNV